MRGETGILPVMDVGNNGNNGFSGNGDWAWIIVLFLIFGYGRNGFGGGFGGGGVPENFVLQTDFATLERKLDSVNSGLCDGFYAMAQQFSNTNQNISNSTASLQNTLCQGFNGLNVAYLQGTNNITSQIASCCCDLRAQLADCCCTTQRAIDNVNYNMATNSCAITNAINTGIRDIVDNQNANYRALHDELVANKLEMKNDRIAEQQNEINALRLKASQEAQNNYLISQLKPCPDPAYLVPNPNCCYNPQVTFNACGGCNY